MKAKKVDFKDTFGYWFLYNAEYGTVFSLGKSGTLYMYIGTVDYKDSNFDTRYIHTVRRIKDMNFTTLVHEDVTDKKIFVLR